MPLFQSQEDEVLFLTDTLFDGQAGAAEIQRLEALMLSDLGCFQKYIERINFHGVIFQTARRHAPQEERVSLIDEINQTVQLEHRRRQWLMVSATSVITLAFCVLVGWFIVQSEALKPAQVASICHLTHDSQSEISTMKLGQILRSGESLTIKSGIVSLELPHVSVDLIGPAKVRLDNTQQLSLKSGTIVAKILDQGQGFTVQTPVVEVIDLGTEFTVTYHPQDGAFVSVKRGRVRTNVLDSTGHPQQVLELTDHRSARFDLATRSAQEVPYLSENFDYLAERRGSIRSFDGLLRTPVALPVSLRSKETYTHNHILVIPERQNIKLQQDLNVIGIDGPVKIPAGSIVDSFLVHYDPSGDSSLAPRGAVTFHDEICAILVGANELAATDELLGLRLIPFDEGDYRGLELGADEDEVHLSGDRRTVSFDFDTSPPSYLDEARILVISQR